MGDQSELQNEMLFWVCPHSSRLLFFLSWLGCSFPPGQKSSLPKSSSAPTTPNSFFLLYYVVHTCGLLISCLQILPHKLAVISENVITEILYFNGPLGNLKLSSNHPSLNLPHRNRVNCFYSQNHPLSQSASPCPWGYHLCCRSLLSTAGCNDTVWKVDLAQKIWSIPSSRAEGVPLCCPCRSHHWVSPLSLSSSVTLRANLCS